MKNIIKIVFSVIAILFGIFLFIFGGYDDSPGAQGLGLVFVTIGIYKLIKFKKKNKYIL